MIVPTYNRQRLLRLTLESLTRQSLPTDRFEVLVADDGSSDGTRGSAPQAPRVVVPAMSS
ncbi:glycosyltransferase family 2 protein [Streptomyces sp. GESEQ-4]|uniref:glycosyltransferase n=1 Tax=Streptomyces sp. GESEQ-4 TaxID=2812655 RepID=UPI0035A88CCB